MGIKSHYLEDSHGNKFYPYAHANATFDSNGVKVGTRLDNIDNNISNINKNINEHIENTDIHFTIEERKKLSDISPNANNYILPSAGTELGGIKSGGDLTITEGVAIVNDDSHNHVVSNIDGLQNVLDEKVPTTRTVNGKTLSANIALSASDVGADASGTANTVLLSHNSSATAHSDIRNLIFELTTRLNTLADSDDNTLDQISEIVTYIKNNKSLIDSITTSKIDVSDIADNLITNISTKVLSANQGVIIKTLIDTLQSEVDKKLESSGTIANATNASTATYAISAGSATKASSATSATYASTANYGKNAGTANYSSNSAKATSATSATYSSTASYSLNGDKATSATSATYAATSTKAGTSTYSSSSAKAATLDGLTSTIAELNYTDGVTSNIQTQLNAKAKGASISAKTAATAGWYRIATSAESISNCTGIFQIIGSASGKHTTATISSGTSYGVANSSSINVLQCSHFSSSAISKVRIVYHTTYSGNYAYLEVYNPNASATTITVNMIGGAGWTLVTPSTTGSVPDGYASKEVTLSNNTMVAETFSGTASKATSATSATYAATSTKAGTATYASNAPTYVGATTAAAGTKGFVPVATTATKDNFLRGDGVWAVPSKATSATSATYASTANYAKAAAGATTASKATSATSATYAATSTKAGTATYASNAPTYVGATTAAAGTKGFVPAATTATRTSFLRGDGAWATPTNTKNTAGSTDTSSKIFLIGATTQAANPQTYSHDTVYVGTDGCLYSGGIRVRSEISATTEPTNQTVGDYWCVEY